MAVGRVNWKIAAPGSGPRRRRLLRIGPAGIRAAAPRRQADSATSAGGVIHRSAGSSSFRLNSFDHSDRIPVRQRM
jgi:hypothetical protein